MRQFHYYLVNEHLLIIYTALCIFFSVLQNMSLSDLSVARFSLSNRALVILHMREPRRSPESIVHSLRRVQTLFCQMSAMEILRSVCNVLLPDIELPDMTELLDNIKSWCRKNTPLQICHRQNFAHL